MPRLSVFLRPSIEALEMARPAIIAAICKAAGYDVDAATSSRGQKYADVRFLVALALRSRKARVADATKVARIGGHAYHDHRRQREPKRYRTLFHVDRDPRVIRAALEAAAIALPDAPRRKNVDIVKRAIASAAAEEGIPLAEAATRQTRAAIRARRKAIMQLRDSPLPWSVIVDGLGLSRLACMRAYYAAKHGHPKRWPSTNTAYRHQRAAAKRASAC